MSTVTARTENAVIEFDGRVLEIFASDGSTRLLASELTYQRSESDKKGRVSLTFVSFGRGTRMLMFQPELVPEIDALVAALDAAGVQRS